MILCVLIRFRNDPGGSIRNALENRVIKIGRMGEWDNWGSYEVEDLSLVDECMQGIHDFLYRGTIIPPVHIENVDIGSAQLLEGFFHGHMERFVVVTGIINFVRDTVLASLIAGSILSRVSTSTTELENLNITFVAMTS